MIKTTLETWNCRCASFSEKLCNCKKILSVHILYNVKSIYVWCVSIRSLEVNVNVKISIQSFLHYSYQIKEFIKSLLDNKKISFAQNCRLSINNDCC